MRETARTSWVALKALEGRRRTLPSEQSKPLTNRIVRASTVVVRLARIVQ